MSETKHFETDSENTLATWKEMTRTYPNQSLDTLISLWHMAVCSLSLHLGSSESRKTLEQKFIYQIGTLNRHGINKRFSFNLFILVFRQHIPTNSVAPFSVPFKLITVANFRYQLS